jgi:hypothetical protein
MLSCIFSLMAILEFVNPVGADFVDGRQLSGIFGTS